MFLESTVPLGDPSEQGMGLLVGGVQVQPAKRAFSREKLVGFATIGSLLSYTHIKTWCLVLVQCSLAPTTCYVPPPLPIVQASRKAGKSRSHRVLVLRQDGASTQRVVPTNE